MPRPGPFSLVCLAVLLMLAACHVPTAAPPEPVVPMPTATPHLSARAAALQQLGAARDRWAAHPVDHYRLAVQFHYGGGPCELEAEVAGEQVLRLIKDSCESWLTGDYDVASTVTGLFDFAERNIKQWEGICGPNGCQCDVLHVQSEYDLELGFLRRLQVIQLTPTPSAPPPEPPEIQAPISCTLLGFHALVFEMQSFTPLP